MSEEQQMKFDTFDTVLNGAEEQPQAKETKPEVEPEVPKPEVEEPAPEQPEQEPAKEPEPEVQAAEQPKEEPKMVPLDVLLKERDKWRTRAEELESQIQSAPQPEPVEYDEDPYGYVNQMESRLNSKLSDMKMSMSETVVKQLIPDYDDKLGFYAKYAQQNPQLVQQVQQSDNPALLAYNLGKQFETQEKYGSDPDAMRKAIRAEVEAELKKDYEKRMTSNLQAAAKQPTNVQNVRAAPGSSTKSFKHDTFLDILGR